jgi:hypothetical protein
LIEMPIVYERSQDLEDNVLHVIAYDDGSIEMEMQGQMGSDEAGMVIPVQGMPTLMLFLAEAQVALANAGITRGWQNTTPPTKSEMVRDYATNLGIEVVEMRLTTVPDDTVRGLPTVERGE